MKPSVRFQSEDFSQDEEIARLKAHSLRTGAVATFLGCARDFSEGRAVSELDFEAYGDMALAEMRVMREQAIAMFTLIDAVVVHRLGTVKSGENIVFIGASAEHRAEALEGCQWLIDELKRRVPIWKREITPEGAFWVVPHA